MSYKNAGFVGDVGIQPLSVKKLDTETGRPLDDVNHYEQVDRGSPPPFNNDRTVYNNIDTTVTMPVPTLSPITSQPMEEKPLADKPYAGMGKEDLLRFSNTPFWIRLRLVCLVLFWLAWLGLLVAVIVLTVIFPRCKAPPTQPWWRNATFYQVYVKSFYDADNNGVGDFKGIESKLDHLSDMKTTALMLSAFYQSKTINGDFGYDWSDHVMVNPAVGNMADFDAMLNTAHAKKLKVVVDFVPNHTGDDHQWFVTSRMNRDNDKANYYVWADNKTGTNPPNNWKNVYGQPAWTYDPGRGQWYLHQFLSTQPDLNLRSRRVTEELEGILKFWLDKGVDGFRVNAAGYLFEDYDLRDAPSDGDKNYTFGLPETHELIARWRSLIDGYENNVTRVLITDAEGYTDSDNIKFYGINRAQGAGLPINYLLSRVTSGQGGMTLQQNVKGWQDAKPVNTTTPWLSGDHDRGRLASRVGTNYGNVINMLKMTLPGAALHYYGEEISMLTVNVPSPIDPAPAGRKRDGFRTPMQWDNSTTNAGFSNQTGIAPWLPVGNTSINLQVQTQGNAYTPYNLFKKLGEIRQSHESLWYGRTHYVTDRGDQDAIFSFVREYDGKDRLLVVANLGSANKKTKFYTSDFSVPGSAEVAFSTTSSMTVGTSYSTADREIPPGHGVIFKWAYSR